MTKNPLAPGSRALLVISPLVTLRWRQGLLQLSSPRNPEMTIITPAILSFLSHLTQPRTVPWLLDTRSTIERSERREILARLLDSGIVEVVKAPRESRSGAWWDEGDRARYDATALQILQIAHGFARSSAEALCTDHWGRPLPWIARPVVDFLFQLDLSELAIFEYGGGASTFYWARRCASVVCVEHQECWASDLSDQLDSNVRILLRTDPCEYAKAILETPDVYDIILIDAAPAFRADCVEPALERLSSRGMVILDDAPFYPESAAQLRAANLIEVDLTGFSPLEDNLQTTSLFLSREFDLPRRNRSSPVFPFGSPGFDWRRLAPED